MAALSRLNSYYGAVNLNCKEIFTCHSIIDDKELTKDAKRRKLKQNGAVFNIESEIAYSHFGCTLI